MKIIKYETDSNDFCLIHKTKMFNYYLFFKNNNYYYYESVLKKKFMQTKRIASKILNKKIIKTYATEHDDFLVACAGNNFISEKINDFHICSETFGLNKYDTFCVFDKNLKNIKKIKGQKHSPTFIFSYILYKFNLNLSLHFHSFSDFFIKEVEEKDKKKIKKYAGILYYKYQKYNFEDINIDSELIWNSLDKRYLMKTFLHYDNIINIDTVKIINHFNLEDKEKKLSYISYAMCYFSTLFFIDFIEKNKINNSNISIFSCLFKIKLCRFFLENNNNNNNNFFYSPFNSFKNGLLFFTNTLYNDKFKLLKNKYEKIVIKKIKKTNNIFSIFI
jgi:hypothetical protein